MFELLRHLLSRLRQWSWSVIVLRVLLAAFAVLLLAWIGRAAAANGAKPPLASLTPPALASSDGAAAAAPRASLFADGGLPPPLAPFPPPPDASGSATVPAAPPASAPSPSRATPDAPVYINHASADELRRLPGVGAKRAEAILVLRQRLGRFHRVEDLLRVKGVGRTTVKRWRPLVRLDAPPSAASGDAGT